MQPIAISQPQLLPAESSSSSPSSFSPPPPPSYSPSVSSAPSYAAEPSEDEESLEVAVRPQTPIPRGKFTVKAGDIIVTLHEQEFGAGIPTYRQNAVIKGDVEITPSQGAVIALLIRLEGRQILTIPGAGRNERLLFSENHDLWTRTPRAQGNETSSTIHSRFHVPFPVKFVDKAYAHPLVVPPTFDVKFSGESSFSARNEYTLFVIVTVERLAARTKHDSITLPILLNYRPRSRPYRPIAAPLLPFFETLKTAPEEWFQVSSSVPPKDAAREPMDCHLFIPRAQIYALGDTIPFHLQLRASAELLRNFLGVDAIDDASALESTPGSLSQTIPRLSWGRMVQGSAASPTERVLDRPHVQAQPTHRDSSPVVRVYFQRQVSIRVKGVHAFKDVILGEGKLTPVEHPPPWYTHRIGDSPARTTRADDYSLDWEGEVRCEEGVRVPSFVSGALHVKDSVVVHLRPADMRVAVHGEHWHLHTVRFVTDRYRDVHPSDG
ncbi:hypothetical protein BDY19DRAFT_517629 [Irpex rosettiformis]|uniref:Uncharacterized protein n=1 Tax=Irpex rosettiformis TaxID=378272 RepID=A0ACB8TRQ6_9APHY|nr:hypothetical protein BDY19DRAFT_517629 [Irpex rosettiformis]